jgi:hypothetical protein
MFQRAVDAGKGQQLDLQQCMIFEHDDIMQHVKL